MNKYLLSSFVVFVCMNAYANIYVDTDSGTYHIVHIKDENNISLDKIKAAYKDEFIVDEYVISNSSVIIDDFSDWQKWDTKVSLDPIVSLYINNLDNSIANEKVRYLTATNKQNVIIYDANHLYRTELNNGDKGVFLSLVRETNYEKVFNDSRGKFLENIRLNSPNDKMLIAMDRATNMNEVNSIMNASYHFNPMILMNPIKTINRSNMLDSFTDITGSVAGAKFDYILSDKINNFGTHVYIDNKYEDLSFRIGVNLNSFSYGDDFNEFTGLAYGLDARAKQYINDFWIDGLIGLNRANFKTDNIYINENISNNPNGMSEYLRLNVGYDYTKISEFVFSPFVGFMLQRYEIMDFIDTDFNLHTGIMAKYDFAVDGIKYEYGANIATDEKANWNIGFNVGFLSIVDEAGAYISIDAFKDEFATNYKLSLNAKVQF